MTGGYRVTTNEKTYQAKNVVIATGSFQKPKIPAFSADIPADFYNSIQDITAIPVNCLMAQCLWLARDNRACRSQKNYIKTGALCIYPQALRRVCRAVIAAGMSSAWLQDTGFISQPVETLTSPKGRLTSNPHLSGKDGGHSLNQHQFVRDGVKLLGHISGAQGGKVMFKPDLKENLAKTDKAEKDIIATIDRYIEDKRHQRTAGNTPRSTGWLLRRSDHGT